MPVWLLPPSAGSFPVKSDISAPVPMQFRTAGPDRKSRPRATNPFCSTRSSTTSARIVGIESVLREIFPIESYDKSLRLEYFRYDLGKPRYTPEECRQLRLTYGRPFRFGCG